MAARVKTKTIRRLADLTPDPVNANAHTPRGASLMETSLREVGFGDSLTVDRHGVVLSGNQRLDTLADLQMDNPIVVQSDGTRPIVHQRVDLDANTPQAKRLALLANRVGEVNLSWDAATLRNLQADGVSLDGLWSTEELAALLETPVEPVTGHTDPDDVPAERATSIKLGDLFQLGAHRLLCGDSTKAEDVARVMDGESADCVFTSPPYGVGVDYGTYDDTVENLRSMLPLLAARWRDVVCVGGFAVINFGDIVAGREAAESDGICEYPMALEYWPHFRAAEWALWSRRVWCKPNARVHSPWAIQSNRAASDWEHVWTWKAPGAVIVKRVNGEHQSANGWFDTTSEHGVDVGKETHGAGMAVALPVRMIDIHSRASAVIHEPFCGTGTTIIACEQLRRRCFAIEIEPKYVQVAIDRWEAFTHKKAKKLGEVTGSRRRRA